MKKSEEAVARYLSGFTCSSAVFSTFSEDLGMDGDTAKKLPVDSVPGYRKQGISAVQFQVQFCHRAEIRKDSGQRCRSYRKDAVLVREFIGEFSTGMAQLNCTEILGYNLSDPGGLREGRGGRTLHHKMPGMCPGCCRYSFTNTLKSAIAWYQQSDWTPALKRRQQVSGE